MKIIQLDADEWENVEIDFSGRVLLIEIAAITPIDFGVLSKADLRAFERDQPFDKVVWFTYQRGPKEFPVSLSPDRRPYYLVLWNSNQSKQTAVAYRFSAIESA